MAGRSPEAEIAEALAEDTRQGRVKWRNADTWMKPVDRREMRTKWRGVYAEIVWHAGLLREQCTACDRLSVGGLNCSSHGSDVVAAIEQQKRARQRVARESLARRVYHRVFGTMPVE